MIQNTFLSARELLVEEETRSAAIAVLGHLEREEYADFNMRNPCACVVAKMALATGRCHWEISPLLDSNRELQRIFYCEFVVDRGALDVDWKVAFRAPITQRDAAWVVRHWLERGYCPRPDHYAARHLAMPVLPDEQSLVERVPECIE